MYEYFILKFMSFKLITIVFYNKILIQLLLINQLKIYTNKNNNTMSFNYCLYKKKCKSKSQIQITIDYYIDIL